MAQTQLHLDSSQLKVAPIDRYAWVILFVVFLASVAAPLNMAKVPPLMPVLLDAFQLSLGQGGSLMSVFAVTGLILALPTSFIMRKLGSKTTGLIALLCLAGGAVMGALAPNPEVLLGSRVVEGIGMGLITVVAPAIIATWFPQERRGMPMGLWATWIPVGNVLMYNLVPAVSESMGWAGVWWGGAGFTLLVLVLFGWLMRMPDETQTKLLASEVPAAASQGRQRSPWLNRNIWLLAASFGCLNLVFMAIGTFYPTFLTDVYEYPAGQAAFIASISTMVVLVSAPVAGWLSDRIGSRKRLLVLPLPVIAVMLLWMFQISGTPLYIFMVLMGLVGGVVPTVTFAAVPEVMVRPQLAGIGMAVLSVGQNAGMVIGPILFGALVEAMGWVAAGYWLVPICVGALLAAFFVNVR